MQFTPVIAVHLTAAIAATVIGPFAIWARLGRLQHPKLHRAAGYAWVTLMVMTALSALFIRDDRAWHVAGYGPIHLLIVVTLGGLYWSFRNLARGNIKVHRQQMVQLYVGACLVAGGFTLLPNRILGQLVWGSLGLI